MKRRILFVGSFKKAGKDGSVGGQMFACKTLLESPISDDIDWLLIDSTSDSNKNPSLFARLKKVFRRLLRFFYFLLFKRFDTSLIFIGGNMGGFLEKGLIALISKLAGKKVIIAPRSGLIPENYKNSSFMHRYIPYVVRKVDYVICQGENWKEFYQGISNSKDEKFIVIQNWLNAEPYFNIHKNGQADQYVNILFLSWLNAQKGIFDLIDAAKGILEKHKNVRFWICGEGVSSESARVKVTEYGLDDYFDFKGWTVGEDKMKVLAEADMYVLPSYFEGFPNSLMEAMAAGLPVVATTVGSIPELVSSSENGLLYEAGDVKALQTALEILIVQPEMRKSLAQKAQKTIKTNNTIDVALQKYDDLFARLNS